MRTTWLFGILAVIAGLLTNGSFAVATESQETSVQGGTIAWLDGDVDTAFAKAKAGNKPLFLYWGAVWCPPCVLIKKTVFTSREFIALSELFVPYYLDGDTEEAQATGERFGVKGYPTMIVFDPAGEEITRIPGAIDIDRYNEVLRISLNHMRPTKQLLRMAMTAPDSLEASDYRQLAFYSWGQDFNTLPEGSGPSLFRDLADRAEKQDEISSARLYMQYLEASSREHSDETPVKIEGAQQRLSAILNSDELVVASWESFAYYPKIVKILALQPEERKKVETLWQDRTMALRHNPKLSLEEQLAAWIPKLYFHFESTEEPLPASVVDQLDEEIAKANASVSNVSARHSLVDQIETVYVTARMYDKARALLLKELETSKSPYYFMSGLGALAEREQKPAEALEWYRKAYENSKGSATRFQWGGSYVRALIRLAPDENELILSTAEALFNDLRSRDEVFSGRNFRVLKRLNEQLIAWKSEEQSDAVAQRFSSRIEALCASEDEGSIEKQNCQSLMEGQAAG